jgi:hypothetical protein
MNVSIRSFNFADRFVRHQNFLGELTPVVSDPDRRDATFSWLAGLSDGRFVSFGSVNLPSRALRHSGFRIRLDDRTGAGDTALQRADSTFVLTPGLADPTAVSFRSVNFPDRFLRHRDFHLFVEPVDAATRADATFSIVPGLAG